MYEFLEYQVADAMTYHPVTITRATPLAEVEALFEEHDFNCLPVCEEGGSSASSRSSTSSRRSPSPRAG